MDGDLRAEIEAARRTLAETAEALAARSAAPAVDPAPPLSAAGTEPTPAVAGLPVRFRTPRARRSVTVAGAVLAAVALLLRRRLAR